MNLSKKCSTSSNCIPLNNLFLTKCEVRIPTANLTSIIDISWDGTTKISLPTNSSRPNSHSFIIADDILPSGYNYNSINQVLTFPPNINVSQFAVWSATGEDSCGGYSWVAVKLCLANKCSPMKALEVSDWVDSNLFINEVPIGLINGTNKVFRTLNNFIPESVDLEVNSVTQELSTDFNTTGSNTITLANAPLTGQTVLVSYIKQ